MKKLCTLFFLAFLFISGNAFAVEFSEIGFTSATWSGNYWALESHVVLNDYNSSVTTVSASTDGNTYLMPHDSIWGGYLDAYFGRVVPSGGTPTPEDFNGVEFTWTVVVDGTEALSAKGTIPENAIRAVPLMDKLSITGNPLNPTLSWSNPDLSSSLYYRVRLFDTSMTWLAQWDTTASTFTFPDNTLNPGSDYIIRVEARDDVAFTLTGDLPTGYTPWSAVINRSNTEFPFAATEATAEGNVLELTTGSPVSVSQDIGPLTGGVFNVEFDYLFTTSTGFLDVFLDGESIGTTLHATSEIGSEFLHGIFHVDDPLLKDQTVLLMFQLDTPPEFQSQILIDNILFSWLSDHDSNSETPSVMTSFVLDNFDNGIGDWETDIVPGSGATVGTRAVPEPATLLLLGAGLIGLIGFRRRFKK